MMSKKCTVKVISICTLVLLFFIVFFTYRQYDDYKTSELKYTKIEQSMEEQFNMYIQDILKENQKKAEMNIGVYTNIIHEQMLKEYGNNLENLENDITNPYINSRLTKILDNSLTKVYINEDNQFNKPFVASMENILWDRTLGYTPDDKSSIGWEEFGNKQFNTKLAKLAIESLQSMNVEKHDFIFWEAINNSNPEHKKIDNMDFDELFRVFRKEGIETFKSYEILVPMYITKDGDIFGTKDINSLGHKIKNYKIIIIQRMNVYDALKPYEGNITYFQSEISKIENEIELNNKYRATLMVKAAISAVFTIIASGCLQNKINKENK